MAAPMKPPQTPIDWSHTPQALLSEVASIIESSKASYDSIASIPPEQCTFQSVFLPLARLEADLKTVTEPLTFYLNVSPSKELRDASNEASNQLHDFAVDIAMRLDLFQASLNAKKNIDASGTSLNPEETRLVEKTLLDGKRAGLLLPEDAREQLVEKKKLLSKKCLEFNKNFNEESGKLSFTLAELEGVPTDVISGYHKHPDKDLYDVTYKTPDLLPIYKFAGNPETRRRALIGAERRLAINVPILDEIFAIRRQLAVLLEYPTWADYVTEEKMVKTAKNASKFLDDLESRLIGVGKKDREGLLKLKQEECEKRGIPFDNEFYLWDYRYYDRIYTESRYELDDSLVKAYFPVDVVVPTILKIYQELLGVEFHGMEGTTWHPEVQQFTVWNSSPSDQDDFLGFCYFDLYPRESKYAHAAVWSVVEGYDLPSGLRNFPVAAMVANLAKPTPDRPALMTHDDVVTFFHEMGHVFHGLLSRTQFGRFHGTQVARDFVEAPSQMLENWCWEPKVLKRMSSHYETKEPLPDDLIDKIIKTRYVNVGLYFLRQLFFAKFDMKVHTSLEELDTTKLWNEMREQISLVKGPDPHEPGQGSFGHLTGDYDAGYYGYTYSLVFAADMYNRVFKEDPLSHTLGKLYRDKILRPGGSRDEMRSLEDFLGRPPNNEAFLHELFGNPASISHL